MGSACPNNGEELLCDNCEDAAAVFSLNGENLCHDCAKKWLDEVFADLSIAEKAEALGEPIERLA